MQIDRIVIFESEHDTSHGIARSTLLCNATYTIGQHLSGHESGIYMFSCSPFDDVVSMFCKIATISCVSCHILIDDALRDAPFGVDLEIGDFARKQRCTCFACSTAYAHGEALVLLVSIKFECRYVYHHTTSAQRNFVCFAPSATLHIDQDTAPVRSFRIVESPFEFFIERISRFVSIHLHTHPIGKNLIEADLRRRYDVNVVAIKRDGRTIVNPKAQEVFQPEDEIIVLGTHEGVKRMGVDF